jgi:hypothetical protein
MGTFAVASAALGAASVYEAVTAEANTKNIKSTGSTSYCTRGSIRLPII